MPPRKKGRKRGSAESDKSKDGDGSFEPSDLLSPSEVVKMRKKIAHGTESPSKETSTKEKDSKGGVAAAAATTIAAGGRAKTGKTQQAKTNRKSQEGIDKKKEMGKKKEKSESDFQKKTKGLKERKKTLTKKQISNSDNDVNTAVLYPCGICTKEVCDTDDAILCEAGCEYWYHRNCTGMTDVAYQLLTNEENAEWVCDKCIATKSVPLVKIKSVVQPIV